MTRFTVFLILGLISISAHAYIGPGAGISVLGGIFGVIAAVFLAIAAVLLWPIRRMMKRRKARKAEGTEAKESTE